MKNYYLKRILTSLLTLLVILFLLFLLVRIVPGNPFDDEQMTPEQIELKRAEMGLDDPLLVQFGRYMKNFVKGDFGKGTSLYSGVPVKSVLKTSVKNSLLIGFAAAILGIFAGIVIGAMAAAKKKGFWPIFCSIITVAGTCLPAYVILIYLQQLFTLDIPLFPLFFDEKLYLNSMVIPAVAMAFFPAATIARFTKNEMSQVLKSDYIRFVESKGITGVQLMTRHVLRNSLIPLVTVIAPVFVSLLTGAAVIENLYAINGMGRLMVEAISGAGIDYNYVLILGIIYSAIYMVVMLLLDILYGVIDPRVSKLGEGGNA